MMGYKDLLGSLLKNIIFFFNNFDVCTVGWIKANVMVAFCHLQLLQLYSSFNAESCI